MIQRLTTHLSGLYESDETAWLEEMAELVRQGRWNELDYPHLEEYLADMARRDRREVESRLVVLIAHVLKWVHQPESRTRSWRLSIVEQRQELARLTGRGVLRNHAETILGEAYTQAVERATIETGPGSQIFPSECSYSVAQLLSPDLLGE